MLKGIFRITGAAIILLPLLLSCNRKVTNENPLLLTGNVSPLSRDYLIISAGAFLDSVKPDASGRFSMNILLDQPAHGIMLYNNRYKEIYLEPGSDLDLSINPERFPDEIRFEGSLGAINQYLTLAARLDLKTTVPANELYARDPESFIRFTDSVRDLKLVLLKEYLIRYPGMDSVFVRSVQTDIWFGWGLQRLLYPAQYLLLTNLNPGINDNWHPDYLALLDLNQADNLSSATFRSFLDHYLNHQEANYLSENPSVNRVWFPASVARFRVIYRDLTQQEVKDWALFQAMSDHLDSYGTINVESFINDFRFHCKNQQFQESIEKKLASLDKLARGNDAIDFTMINLHGKKEQLSRYFGKLLYIQFWATWSEWSLGEMAWWESLRKEFEPRGVTFISVSMDFARDLKKWEYLVKSKELGGVHCIQDPKSTLLQESYFVDQLPRYFIMDQAGKIISVHAPAPSEESTRKVLENLLERGE